jgi:hypothetical protein
MTAQSTPRLTAQPIAQPTAQPTGGTRRTTGWGAAADERPGAPRYRYSIWHHPRVFRLRTEDAWCWQCGCGSSGHAVPQPGQRAAALAAIAHVHSRPVAR